MNICDHEGAHYDVVVMGISMVSCIYIYHAAAGCVCIHYSLLIDSMPPRIGDDDGCIKCTGSGTNACVACASGWTIAEDHTCRQ